MIKGFRAITLSSIPSITAIGVSIGALLLTACSSPEGMDSAKERLERQKNAEAVKENVENYHAQLAAERSNVCPKLIQREVDSDVIERSQEVMSGDYCDYFLYPNAGQSISVTTDNSDLKILLVVPTMHDFANGDYKVKSYDKHVIRLSYNGFTYRPENLTYDVDITVKD